MYILIKHDKDRNRDVEFFKNGKVRIKFSVFYLQEDFVVTRGFSITLNAYRQQLQVQNKLTHMSNQFFLKYRNGIILCMALQVMFQCTVYADVNTCSLERNVALEGLYYWRY